MLPPFAAVVYRDNVEPDGISPTWSPNGARIMFALDPTADEFSHPVNSLYVINATGLA